MKRLGIPLVPLAIGQGSTGEPTSPEAWKPGVWSKTKMIIAYNRDDLDNHLEKMEQETHFDKDIPSTTKGLKWVHLGDCPYQRSEICPFPFQTLTPNHFRPFNYFPSLPSWPLILKVRDSSTGRFEILNLGFWNLGLCFFLTSYILEFGFLMLDFYILEFWILGFWDDVEFKFGIFGFGSFCFF